MTGENMIVIFNGEVAQAQRELDHCIRRTPLRPLRSLSVSATNGRNESVNGRSPEFWSSDRLSLQATAGSDPLKPFATL